MAEAGQLFHVYPYREEEEVSGHFVERPTLDIELSTGSEPWKVKALLDTGAPLSVFDKGAAQALGINVRDYSKPEEIIRVGGKRRRAVLAFVTLTLPEFPDRFWDAEVGFFDTDWPVPYGILGHQGFFDHWVVSFNRYRNYFVVEPIEEWEKRMPVDPFELYEARDRGEWERPTNR